MLTRRGLIGSLAASLLCAPAVIKSSALMPVSALKLPPRQFVRAIGLDAGSIEFVTGSTPTWGIPCDGRLVNGFDYPDLFKAVRGRSPSNPEDDWVHIAEHHTHPFNPSPPTIDYYHTMSWPLAEKTT